MSKEKAQLEKKLWAVADTLRGQMSPSEFQNYALGIIFYKYLSEKQDILTTELLSNDNITYDEAYLLEEYREELEAALKEENGYSIKPEHLYRNLIKEINKGSDGNWSTDLLQTAFNQFTESTRNSESGQDFTGLLSEINLNSTVLGKDIPTRSKLMGKIIKEIGTIDFKLEDTEIDVLGDAYEYMIGEFASGAGKKGGEFYTPQSVSTILARIVSTTPDGSPVRSIYDPTCGSGSLLLRVHKEARRKQKETENTFLQLSGQELNTATYNLARMNMILHGVNWRDFNIQNGNTLTEDLFHGKQFDAIVANPPYSAKWEPNDNTLQDERYAPYGKVAPSSKADYAFITHTIHHLSETGTAAVVLPHGVLFRSGAEGTIREKILKDNLVDAVIGLPENLFYGTGIPTCIIVFRKNREEDEPILFIDASRHFEKSGNKNALIPKHIKKIVKTYTKKKTIERYSRTVKLSEITENDYNLNIPRYVDSREPEPEIDLTEVEEALLANTKRITELDAKIAELKQQLVEIPANTMTKADDNE